MTIRSRRTNAKIQQAFLDLLETHAYETITVSAIARQAMCHRTTVHRHYADKDSLLLACFEAAAETVKEGLVYPQKMVTNSPSQIAYANLVVLYTHVADNRALYRALLTTVTGGAIRTRFRRFVAGVTLNIMGPAGSLERLPAPSNVVGNLLADMIVGAIVWWLESNATYDPALLAEIVLRLAETGFFGLTGQAAAEGDISFTPFPANWGEL